MYRYVTCDVVLPVCSRIWHRGVKWTECQLARVGEVGDFSTAMFFLHAVVVQLKCALFGTNVRQCDVCACVIRHAHYLVGKCARYVGLMLLTIVYTCINII